MRGQTSRAADAIRTAHMAAICSGVAGEPAHGASREHANGELVLHSGDLVPVVRTRLKIGDDLSDDAILASLAAIASLTGARDRWQGAFGSALGSWLASRGRGLNTALNVVMALVPSPRS